MYEQVALWGEEMMHGAPVDPLFTWGSRIHIAYENAEGVRSKREIRVYRTYRSRSGVRYLEAFCYLRQERRTFRFDRVLSAMPTGESEPTPPGVIREARDPAARHSESPFSPAPDDLAVALPATSSPASNASAARLSRVSGVLIALGVAVIIATATLWQKGTTSVETTGALSSPVGVAIQRAFAYANASSQPVERAAARQHAATAFPPIRSFPYRGHVVEERSSPAGRIYTVTSLGIATSSLREAYLGINARLFEQRTHIHDSRLEAIYAAADTDGNGHLSWQEIVSFQKTIYLIFTYQANSTALRPDQFLDQRGGDCEDWALFTAGLLHYWGWNAEIATFSSINRGPGHAMTFVRVAHPIPGLGSYIIDPAHASASRSLRAGTYIPIDYNAVGSLSNAVESGDYLTGLYDPESLYGKVM